MRGRLDEFGVVDLLQLFQLSGKTGTLEVRDGRHAATLYFDRGRLSGVGADHWSLVAELRRIEWLAPEVRQQVDLLEQDGSHVGLSLLARALLTPAVWDQFVERQVEALIYPLLELTQGEFVAAVEGIPRVAPLRLDLAPQQLILSAARWQEEVRRAAYEGMGPASVWRRTAAADGRTDELLLTLLRHPRSIADLAAAAGASVLQTVRQVARLSREALVEPIADPPAPGSARR
ncbi:MAG: DUF4388 domain-containing protein [Sphaerobacter sp.]|nr:DUF4388 domain-containing protein [Sphaerobacter sp.]